MGILRNIYRRQQSQNPETHEIENLECDNECHRLIDPAGGLESVHIQKKTSHACGCFGPIGGRCSERGCGRISCARCHSHCGGSENPSPLGCGKSLCREHAHYLPMPDGRTVPFCKRCHGQIVRSQRWRAIGRTLLPVFIEDGDDE